jgi:hypothetical protein
MADRPEVMAVGVEEEFHTVDLETHRLLPRADSLLEQLPADRFGTELQRSVVETNSRPFVRLIDLAEDLAALRRGVVAVAESLGLGIVAAGTVPVVDLDSLKVTPDPRYENMLEEYQALAREQLICGAQVHVDVRDRDLAVAGRALAAGATGDLGEFAVLARLRHRLCQLPDAAVESLADQRPGGVVRVGARVRPAARRPGQVRCDQ